MFHKLLLLVLFVFLVASIIGVSSSNSSNNITGGYDKGFNNILVGGCC